MSKRYPITPATLYLRNLGIKFNEHYYDYKRKGSDIAAEGLGVSLHEVIKTLIMQKETGEPFVVLQHGDKEVSLKELARQIGTKSVFPCEVKDAQRHTGYLIGGISPFGTKKALITYVEDSILSLPRFFINGGIRGFILEMSPSELQRALKFIPIKVSR